MDHADVDYLESKRSVDGRARSRRVRDRLLSDLPDAPVIVDAGAGTGAVLPTLLEWGVREGSYRGIEQSATLVDHAGEAQPTALAGEYAVATGERGFTVEGLSVRFETGDVLRLSEGDADLVIGQALLDLVPVGEAVDAISGALRPGGLAYLPITFDGASLFLPEHPDDDAVVGEYHAAIDEEPGRDSRAGRHLVEHLQGRPGDLLAVAASDWIVRPRSGDYPADEARFLSWVLDFVESALEDRPADPTDWLAERRRQREERRLTYVAHNYDLLYRTPEA